jgi:hypothetical protein
MSRDRHFALANNALRRWGKSPSGWTWHHSPEPGVMQLVPRIQHTPGSEFWHLLHGNGNGGYHLWAIPAGAKPN